MKGIIIYLISIVLVIIGLVAYLGFGNFKGDIGIKYIILLTLSQIVVYPAFRWWRFTIKNILK